MEQSAVHEGIQLAKEWGPIWTCAVLFFMWELAKFGLRHQLNRGIGRTRDEKMDNLAEKIENLSYEKSQHDEIKKDLILLKVDMEKKVPYSWLEAQVVPRLDNLIKEVATVNNNLASMSVRLTHLEKES